MADSSELNQAIDRVYDAFLPANEEGLTPALNQGQLDALKVYRPFIPEHNGHPGMEERKEDIEAFKKMLQEHNPPLTPEDWEYATDVVLYRYLVAREFDFEKSQRMLLHSLAWRKDAFLRLKDCVYCLESKKNHPMRVVGFSKNGSVAIYTDFKHSARRDGPSGINHFVATLEKSYEVYKALNLPSYKVVVMIHFEGFGWPDINPKLAMDIGTTLSDQYPERMERILMIDAPRIFEPFMNVLKPFLAPETVAKISFVKSSDNIQKIFHDLFPPHLAEKLNERVIFEKKDKI